MLYGFHDAEEEMLSMTMGCDGPHSEKVLKRNKQNEKTAISSGATAIKCRVNETICWNNCRENSESNHQ